jgi:SnoaL-like domain
LILSAFRPDAIDHHGHFVGSSAQFIEWLSPRHRDCITTQHFVSNHSFDFTGDTAHVETYLSVAIRRATGPIEFCCGRYADRFERRDEGWKILRRVVVTEWNGRPDSLPVAVDEDIGSRDGSDVSYLRVLDARPAMTPR